jgi:hypothetical protein
MAFGGLGIALMMQYRVMRFARHASGSAEALKKAPRQSVYLPHQLQLHQLGLQHGGVPAATRLQRIEAHGVVA